MADPTYDDDEIQAILARAASLSGSAPEADQLNLVQLQEVGAEVGIEPAMVARAARELERERALAVIPESTPAKVVRGEVTLERHLPGTSSRRAPQVALSSIQEHMGEIGLISLQEDMLVWTSLEHARELTITVRATPAGTVIKGKHSLVQLKGGAYGGWLGGLGGGLGGGLAWLFGLMFGFFGVVGWLLGCLWLGLVMARVTIHRGVESRQARLNELSDAIARQLTALEEPQEPGRW